MHKIPYLLVIGERELKDKSISVRARGAKDLGSMSVKEFTSILSKDIKNKK
jgi:threonyl-tRNA synthetase